MAEAPSNLCELPDGPFITAAMNAAKRPDITANELALLLGVACARLSKAIRPAEEP